MEATDIQHGAWHDNFVFAGAKTGALEVRIEEDGY